MAKDFVTMKHVFVILDGIRKCGPGSLFPGKAIKYLGIAQVKPNSSYMIQGKFYIFVRKFESCFLK